MSSPPPCALSVQPLSGDEAAAVEIEALLANAPEVATDLWPRAVRLGMVSVLSLASWGLLLCAIYGLRNALG